MSSNFLRALENEEHGETPVWYMRQAGRFLKEYQELRKVYSMNLICYFSLDDAYRINPFLLEEISSLDVIDINILECKPDP